MKRFVIVGLGNFGSCIAKSLATLGHDVIAIDRNAALVDGIGDHVARAVVGDATNRDTLERIGVSDADAAVVSTGDDISACILATMMLQDLHIKQIYAKVISEDHARIMDRLGVTEVVFPERDTARSLAVRVSGSVGGGVILNFVQLGQNFSLQEMGVPTSWEGKSIRQLELRQKYDVTIVAVNDVLLQTIKPSPNPDYILKDTDTLMMAGEDDVLARLAKLR